MVSKVKISEKEKQLSSSQPEETDYNDNLIWRNGRGRPKGSRNGMKKMKTE